MYVRVYMCMNCKRRNISNIYTQQRHKAYLHRCRAIRLFAHLVQRTKHWQIFVLVVYGCPAKSVLFISIRFLHFCNPYIYIHICSVFTYVYCLWLRVAYGWPPQVDPLKVHVKILFFIFFINNSISGWNFFTTFSAIKHQK